MSVGLREGAIAALVPSNRPDGGDLATVRPMRYRFGSRTLDTRTLQLLDGGEEVALEPQVLAVLTHLLEHRDRVVPKSELLDAVWGSRFVSESALSTRIKQARQAVGDSGQQQAVIRTHHGRGFRFVAPVTVEGTAPAPPRRHLADEPVPTTRYAEADGASIAYQTFGEGPDVVLVAGFATNVEVQWEHPMIADFLRRLGQIARVTLLDKRGVGLSDRLSPEEALSLETRADDLCAVMDAVGIERATILGSSEGGSLSAVFAATHADRVQRLVLHNTWMVGPTISREGGWDLDRVLRRWGEGKLYAILAPTLAAEPGGRELLARFERLSATPRTARHLLELIGRIDITEALTAITVPTLVLHRREDPITPLDHGRQIAERVRSAELVELQGADHYLCSGDPTETLAAVERFLSSPIPSASDDEDHLLATLLFVDVVDSTGRAQHLGDRAWVELLDRFHGEVDRRVTAHRGEVVNTLGDGVLATFDGPGRAVRCALGLRDAVAPLGLDVRSGLHTSEIRRRGPDVAGIGVHLASRVAGLARPGEVWVSRTVTDLVAGTGLAFEDRGTHELRGFDEPWRLFAAVG